jgi:hypothetical protein
MIKKEGERKVFSWRRKYYVISLFLILILILAFYYFLFYFKTGDLVYEKNSNTFGEIAGVSPLKLSYLVYWQNGNYTNELAFNLEKMERVKEGTFDQENNEDNTSQSLPLTMLENRNFSKTLFNELLMENIENIEGIREQIPQIVRIGVCVPNLKCEPWSECQVNYNLKSLIDYNQIKGLEYKSCTDINKCIPDITGSRSCISRVNITVSKSFWCGKEYTEIKDTIGNVLARIDTRNQTDYMDVSINLGGDYCYYCYDGKKNYDETGLDCGGSCQICEGEG